LVFPGPSKTLSKGEKLAAVLGTVMKREREQLTKRIDELEAQIVDLQATQAARAELVP
jgi:hypothetical protein